MRYFNNINIFDFLSDKILITNSFKFMIKFKEKERYKNEFKSS